MMIIIGLGNPGKEYLGTRHNIGFAVLDAVSSSFPGSSWKNEYGTEWCRLNGHLLIKPQEYMNVSGPTVSNFLQQKKIAYQPSEILVIHDDLDFPLGELHQQRNRSAGGHNGVQSLIDALGSQDFMRLRFGIGNNRDLNLPAGKQGIPAEDYVLQKFSAAELEVITPSVQQAVELLKKKIG